MCYVQEPYHQTQNTHSASCFMVGFKLCISQDLTWWGHSSVDYRRARGGWQWTPPRVEMESRRWNSERLLLDTWFGCGSDGRFWRWWGGRTRGYCWGDLSSQVGCAALHRREVTLTVLAPVCVTEATKCRLHFLVLLQIFLGPSLSP